MKTPFCLMTSTREAPAGASIWKPSRVSLAKRRPARVTGLEDGRVRAANRHLGIQWLAGDLGMGAVRWRDAEAGGFGVDEVDHGGRGFHAVGVGEVVGAEVLVGEAGELALVVVHLVEEVDGVAEGAAGLDGLVGAGFDAEAA